MVSMAKGIYALVIKLPKSKCIRIGKLGKIRFRKGYYVYIGSALNSLEARLARHERKRKKMHWHIDYFLKHSKIAGILTKITPFKEECGASKQILALDLSSPVKKFGASDCNCNSHLFFFNKNPLTIRKFTRIFNE